MIRIKIVNTNDSMKVIIEEKNNLTLQFNHINTQIYDLKLRKKGITSIFNSIRLKSNLKTARKMADRIESMDKSIKDISIKQEMLYTEAISVIDQMIRSNLDLIKNENIDKNPTKYLLDLIENFENEKDKYSARLMAIHTNNRDWKSIKFELDDDYQKIKLKTIILEDNYQYLNQSIEKKVAHIKTLKANKSVYEEMLSFYRVLEQSSIEDEQEYIDRNQIFELSNRIVNLSKDIESEESELNQMIEHMVSLDAKIKQFQKAFQNFESSDNQ